MGCCCAVLGSVDSYNWRYGEDSGVLDQYFSSLIGRCRSRNDRYLAEQIMSAGNCA
jgi:hypothetical protein